MFVPTFATSLKAVFKVHVAHTEQVSPSGFYLKEGWTETMRQKIEMLLEISQNNRGKIFIYSDCDIVFNPKNFNPEIALKDFGDTPFIATQDDVVQKCAGFMILKGSEDLEKVLQLVLDSIYFYKEDQAALNAVINEFSIPVTILPRNEYCCIRQLEGTLDENNLWNEKPVIFPENMKIFHGNWTTGIEMKTKILGQAYEYIT
jgi:hypothetical protein